MNPTPMNMVEESVIAPKKEEQLNITDDGPTFLMNRADSFGFYKYSWAGPIFLKINRTFRPNSLSEAHSFFGVTFFFHVFFF